MLQEILLERNLVTPGDLELAEERQKIAGGSLADNLLALGRLSDEQMLDILEEPPQPPITLEDVGLRTQFLLDFVLKAMHFIALETVPEVSGEIKLSHHIVQKLFDELRQQKLIEVLGAVDSSSILLRHSLTGMGRERAEEAMEQSAYIGPAPITLEDYRTQVSRQSIVNERVGEEELTKAFSHLTLNPVLLHQLGPAVNSGKALLLCGPSGNGKSSIAEAVRESLSQTVYIPHCIEVGGQIIKIFDPAVHEEFEHEPVSDSFSSFSSSRPSYDHRWVRCRRPTVITGGELTMRMLDLDFDPVSKYYEAPLQVKAMGGIFIIDDFGRQRMRPEDLVNRWIVPLERKVDYLTLHTGKKFQVPFDQLVIFSTNLVVEELMDEAMLRRIKYKLSIDPPSADQYRQIFRSACRLYGLLYTDELVDSLLRECYGRGTVRLAAYHPKFICEHAHAVCRYKGIEPYLNFEIAEEALQNFSSYSR